MMYRVLVTAQNEQSEVILHFSESEQCPFSAENTLYDWLCKNFPLFDWEYDDGDDFEVNPETDYCQFVAYPCRRLEDCADDYVLATFQADNV